MVAMQVAGRRREEKRNRRRWRGAWRRRRRGGETNDAAPTEGGHWSAVAGWSGAGLLSGSREFRDLR
jgi:hypothetical protein